MRILYLFLHPAPYKVNFWNELGKESELYVLLERKKENERFASFYNEKPNNYTSIQLKGIPLGNRNNFGGHPYRYYKEIKPDIVVINGWSSFTEMSFIRKLKNERIPYIFAINGGRAKKKELPLIRKMKQTIIPGARLYLAPDERSADYLAFYGAQKEKIRLFPYSTLFADEILEKPLSAEEKLKGLKDLKLPFKKLYLTVSSFIARKNLEPLINFWPLMPKDSLLLLVGGGPLEKKYRKLIASHNLTNVQLLPFQKHEEILRLFSLATLSLFPSNDDIYGHVVNESLSQGTPVIASLHANASLALLKNKETGFFVDFNKKESLLEALNYPFTTSDYESCLLTARKYTIEETVRAHLSVFEEFMNNENSLFDQRD